MESSNNIYHHMGYMVVNSLINCYLFKNLTSQWFQVLIIEAESFINRKIVSKYHLIYWHMLNDDWLIQLSAFLGQIQLGSSILRADWPCNNWRCFTLFPCLFGKGIVVHARQTYIQQTKTFTKTKLIWDNNTNCQQLYVDV